LSDNLIDGLSLAQVARMNVKRWGEIMDVKDAVKVAKSYVIDLLADEGVLNVGLEEIEFDDSLDMWVVTLGFSRPWNSVRNTLTALTGEAAPKRSYRVLKVTKDGKVMSFKRRDAQD
jgi:hypothetical protein